MTMLTDARREALFSELGLPQELINDAKAADFSLQQLLAFLVKYAPQLLALLASIFGWTTPLPPPIPSPIPAPLAKVKA